MSNRPCTPEEVGPEWARLLRLLPQFDPFKDTGGAWFLEAKALAVCAFISDCVVHVEGGLAGTPFRLEDWQRSFVCNLFGWVQQGAGGKVVRRFREALLYCPRKSGKTPMAAAIALFVFFCDDEPGQQDFIAAADREQAGMLFRQAKGMVERCPMLQKACRIYGGNATAGQSRSIVRESDHSFLRVIAADADTQHGGTTHLAIVDELHTQPNRDLVDVLTTSMASLNRRQPLMLYLTTADFDRPSVCNEKYDHACKVRDGILSDPRFLPAIWEAAREDDWTDPAVWRRANPNLGVSVSEEHLQRECEKAKANPAYENVFRRLHLNQRTGQDVRAIDIARWDAAPSFDPKALDGLPCFGGLDLSTTTDITAWCKLFPPEEEGGVYRALWRLYAPKERARERSKRDRVPYLLWAEQGWLTLTEGDVIDYDVIRDEINGDAKRYDVREVAADRWNATQLITQLQGDGFNVVAFGQGYHSMTAPTKELLALVTSARIAHNANPVLRWMASVFAIEQDSADNQKPSKKRSTDRIDGMVALIMALGRAMLNPVTKSVYEERPLETIEVSEYREPYEPEDEGW